MYPKSLRYQVGEKRYYAAKPSVGDNYPTYPCDNDCMKYIQWETHPLFSLGLTGRGIIKELTQSLYNQTAERTIKMVRSRVIYGSFASEIQSIALCGRSLPIR